VSVTKMLCIHMIVGNSVNEKSKIERKSKQ